MGIYDDCFFIRIFAATGRERICDALDAELWETSGGRTPSLVGNVRVLPEPAIIDPAQLRGCRIPHGALGVTPPWRTFPAVRDSGGRMARACG
jgi:hypothetical protein